MKQAERISVFDIFKIGIGPSSSHTLGPWKAVRLCLDEFQTRHPLEAIGQVYVDLFGSLAKTGAGHGTGLAIVMSLLGEEPETIDTTQIETRYREVANSRRLHLLGRHDIDFDPAACILFHPNKTLPFHANALTLRLVHSGGREFRETYYSIGGGFVVKGKSRSGAATPVALPYPIDSAADLQRWCGLSGMPVSGVVFENEKSWRTEEEIHSRLRDIWHTMFDCAYRGCHRGGLLPGGLRVHRRAPALFRQLHPEGDYADAGEWVAALRHQPEDFSRIIDWISCFALAVNEENASYGRVVTAPTNGAAGVIPATLLYYWCFCPGATEAGLQRFLLVAGELGSIFKKGSTISAAMGGCQAEIGVSSAMAAGALTECLGGSAGQVLMAAEMAMEHHLGLTCDPVGGLVQIPCIERNVMGAVKAITAARLALGGVPEQARVSLDDVIRTMWATARDMSAKYKETSQGGLAVNIPVSYPEC
jgi:L-serine dehydratase